MPTVISYELGTIASAIKTDTEIDTSEGDILIVRDFKFLQKSQVSVYFAVELGSATEVKFSYYVSPDGGLTWFKLPTRNDSTGLLSDIPTKVDATSPTQGGIIQVVDEFPMSATNCLKITGQAVTDKATLKSLYIGVRDN